jgi:hypothetical protein
MAQAHPVTMLQRHSLLVGLVRVDTGVQTITGSKAGGGGVGILGIGADGISYGQVQDPPRHLRKVRLEGAQAGAAPVVVMGCGPLPVVMAEPMAQAAADRTLAYIPEATEVLGR